uniref:Uncharacterized protein n=1 Tax=Fagus sylvatica TaxID=28930 RepID=A0A2N9IA18_FAGSY
MHVLGHAACTPWAAGSMQAVGMGCQGHARLASFRDFGLFLGGRACRGNAKAWAGQAKACDAKAMPWLLPRPRHVPCQGCCQGMGCQGMMPRHVLPRHVLPRHATAKACYAKAMPWLAKACHAPRHATAKACHRPRHVMPRQCHGCQGKACHKAAKACHGQGNANGLPKLAMAKAWAANN